MSEQLALNLTSATGISFGRESSGAPGPDELCADRRAMDDHLRDVQTFLSGANAVIRAGHRYLPAFPREHDLDYGVRLGCAKFTNVFRDLVENLASKPFARTVDLQESSKKQWPQLAEFVEDVDGGGNHLHTFAAGLFFNSIASTIDWLVVDKTPVRRGASLAEEREAGARVYWYRVAHADVCAVYSDVVDGEEIFTHFRFKEVTTVRDGFGEREVERVRMFDRQKLGTSTVERPQYGPAYWQLYEKSVDPVTKKARWSIVGGGQVGIDIIPLIPVTTGRREGRSWRFTKTMDDVVHLQKKLYQSETNLEYAKLLVGSPMLRCKDKNPPTVQAVRTVNGVPITVEEAAEVVVGPKTVLYGDWDYVEIDSNALRFLIEDIGRNERQMREVGRQPLTTDSGNLTVVTTMFAAQKGNSAVQSWALGLKDALERAFLLTARWMNLDDAEPEVQVWTDFSIDLESESAPEFLRDAQQRKLISREAYLAEGKRRNFLSAEYDGDTDAAKIADEVKNLKFLALPEAVAGSGKPSGSGGSARGGNSATSRVRQDLRE